MCISIYISIFFTPLKKKKAHVCACICVCNHVFNDYLVFLYAEEKEKNRQRDIYICISLSTSFFSLSPPSLKIRFLSLLLARAPLPKPLLLRPIFFQLVKKNSLFLVSDIYICKCLVSRSFHSTPSAAPSVDAEDKIAAIKRKTNKITK